MPAASTPPKVLYVISRVTDSKEYEQLVAHWDHTRYTLEFILLNPVEDCGLQHHLRDAGLRCTTVLFRGAKDVPRALAALVRYMGRERPLIVHTNLHEGTLLGLLAARLARIRRTVYTRHHSTHNLKYHPVKGVLYDRFANMLANRIIAISDGVKEILVQREHVRTDRIRLMHHGFDLQVPDPPSEALLTELKRKHDIAAAGQVPLVAVIARPYEWKGLDSVIPAFVQLLRTAPDAQLVLFNWKPTPDIARYEEMLKRIPARNWRTVVFEPRITTLLHAFDVFVHVPEDRHVEAFGLVYIESLLVGVPCIFTSSGVMHDLRELPLAGVQRVPFKNADAITEALVNCAQHPATAEERMRSATTNAESLRPYVDVQHKVGRLLSLYDELAAQ